MTMLAVSILGCALVQSVTAYPDWFFGGDHACEEGLQPTRRHGDHADPVWDTTINMTLSAVDDEAATPIDEWEPETQYNLTITGDNPMLFLVSTSAGVLGDPNNPAVQCAGKAWVTAHEDLREAHSVLWTSPKCCDVLDNVLQIVVTGAGCKHGHYRQREYSPTSSCTEVCESGAKPERMEMPDLSTGDDNICTSHSHGSTHSHHERADEGDEGNEGATPADSDEGDEGAATTVDADEGDEGNEGATPAHADEGDEGDEGAATTVDADEGDEGNEGATPADADEGDEGDEGAAGGGSLEFNTDAPDPGGEELAFSREGDEGDEGDEGGGTTASPAGSASASGTDDSVAAGAEPVAAQEADSPGSDQKKAARSFGVFVLVVIVVAIAGGIAIVVLRRRRMRQQYQDFGALEMRGYDQWSSQAGL